MPLVGALVAAITATVPCLIALELARAEVAVSAYIAAVVAGFLAAGLAVRRFDYGVSQFTVITYALGVILFAWIWGSGYHEGSGISETLILGPVMGLPLLPLLLGTAVVWREVLTKIGPFVATGQSFARAPDESGRDPRIVTVPRRLLGIWIVLAAIMFVIALRIGTMY